MLVSNVDPDPDWFLFYFSFDVFCWFGSNLSLWFYLNWVDDEHLSNLGANGEGEICVDMPAFYGLVSYAVGLTALLSTIGIKVMCFCSYFFWGYSANAPQLFHCLTTKEIWKGTLFSLQHYDKDDII
jgi:hypothetical protein